MPIRLDSSPRTAAVWTALRLALAADRAPAAVVERARALAPKARAA